MATTRAAAAADSGEKMNGEGDLDFTITMNESEDEGSSDDATSKPAKKANGRRGDTPSSPTAKINGKMTSDEDSQSSVSKSSSVKKDKKNKKGEENMEEDRRGDDQAEEDMETEEKEGNNEKGTTSKDATDKTEEGKAKDDADEEAEAEEEKDTAGKEEKSDYDDKDSGDEDEKETKEAGVKEDRDGSSKTGKTQKTVDDDVVEIGEDTPAKQQPFVKVSNTTPASSSSGGASGVTFMGLGPQATSLLTSSAMQLVQVQGGGLMYVPSTIQGLTTTASAYSGMAGKGGISAVANNSLLMQQYMMNQNRAGFSMSPFNQGMRGASPASSPILTNIPEKPTSSLGMIENIRWEVENHINIKPKYAKPNPKAELGHLTKWIFDLGSDLVKEFVYHDLVRIQHSRNSEGTLSKKEKEDFAKLQEIDKELNQKIGHLKIRLNKSCRCGFRTELNNVLYFHQQHAHIERGGFYNCIKCKYSVRQPSAFKFHMESMHGRAGYIENRPSFYECQLCPYETNYTNRLEQHKLRCQRQFRDSFNLHPSCVTGPEVNLCLENVFYYVFTRQFMNTIMPKQQQAALQSAAATKIRDMQSGTDSNAMNMQGRRGIMPNTPASSMVNAARQLVPKPNIVAGNKNMLGQMNNAGQRFQAMNTSKMNVVASQSGAYVSRNQAQNQAASAAATQPPAAHAQGLNQPNNGFEVCEICGGYVKDRKALRIHFYYAHRIDMPFGVFERPLAPLYCATCFARFWTAQGLQKHIEVHKNDMMGSGTTQTSNGVAGKCISCGHRVPNILMHMRMVHNRELRHYLAALMCIFCGSRFSTKKEVESHMGKMHGVIVKNSSVQGGGGLDPSSKAQPHHPPPQGAPAAGYHAQQQHQQAKPSSTTSNQKATVQDPAAAGAKGKGKGRGSQCVLCNLSFNRNVDLTRHCMRVHHTCMKCGLVVVDKESLARHTCLHSASGMRTCQICHETGFHPAYYIKHMRDKHLRKCSVILRHIDRAVVETMKRPITISDSEEEGDDDDNDADKDVEEEKPTEAKRPRLFKKPYKSAAAVEKAKAERARQGAEGDASSKVSEKESGAVVGESSSSKEDKADQEDNKPDTDTQDQSENGDDEGSKSNKKDEGKQLDVQEEKDSSKGSDTAGDGSNIKEQDTTVKESVSNQQCEDSSESKNVKRKLDDSESGEIDSPVRKSRRTSQQVNENQD